MNFKRLIGILLVFTLLFLAAFPAMALTPTREVPEWLPGVIAYDFSDVVNPDFTSSAGEDHGFFYSGGSASEAAKITGSLVDLDGGKGVQLNVTDDLTNVHCHMDAAKVGQWPEAGSPVYGFFLRVTTGDEGIDLCRFRMRYDIVDGTVEDKTDLLCACYLGMGTFGCLRLFDLNGNENYDDVSDGSGYDACVYLPPHFDGYVVIEYSDTVYLELAGYGAEYGAVDAACLRWPDYTSKSFQFYCMMSTYEDSCVTFSDLGYLTGFIGESPSTPTEAPTQAPTQAPTEAPTQAPTEAPTEAPTTAPTEAPTQAPTQAPTEAPTQAPTQAPTATPEPAAQDGNLTWLWIVIAAVVVCVIVVVVVVIGKKKK